MNTASAPVLSVTNLSLAFDTPVVKNVSFTVNEASVTALVGESGSGKTLSCLSILGLQPAGASVSGSAQLRGTELLGLTDKSLEKIRAKKTGFVFQDPRKHLDPSMRIGVQLEKTIIRGLNLDPKEAAQKTLALLEAAELDAIRVARSFPHELSGGMCQRASIMLAIACDPELLIADEPTTALDASVQRSILDLLLKMASHSKMGMIFVSHDLRAVDYVADHVVVMLAGHIVESGPRSAIIANPAHPYTQLLLQSLPDAQFMERRKNRTGLRLASQVNSRPATGCPFYHRCPLAEADCATAFPPAQFLQPNWFTRCLKKGAS